MCVELGSSDLRGTRVSLHGAGIDTGLWAPVVGECNAANIAAAYLSAVVLGSDPDVARRNIASIPPVPGRFQVIEGSHAFPELAANISLTLRPRRRVSRATSFSSRGADMSRLNTREKR